MNYLIRNNMKPFDLEAAKNGAPVCTRNGKKARIICFDRKVLDYEIVAILEDEYDTVRCYGLDGKWDKNTDCNCDLMMYEKPEHQFKPFDKVLVRDDKNRKWIASIFSNMWGDEFPDYPYQCIGDTWRFCIPYEGNEHLLGTTDNPMEE